MKDKSCTALLNANRIGGVDIPLSVGVKTNALPETQESFLTNDLHVGVSTRNVLLSKEIINESDSALTLKVRNMQHWYAMRTTYSRERKAYDYIVSNGGTAFLPTLFLEKIINGVKKIVEVSRIPNVFFVYGTEDKVKEYAYDNVHLPFLRFYYKQHYEGIKIIKEPLIVPERQIRSLKILCSAEAKDIRIVPKEMIPKFMEGDKVTIVEGEFMGVEGRVARWHGQQRVAIIIEGLCVIATAYIPSAYIKKNN